MNIKLSFIVPFYNVEKYIAACLDSLYAQDIPAEEYEVICIDDCSPDNAKQIVKEYQRRYSNLVLIEHDKNKGLSGARNTGIKCARGKYVWFIDSDDYIATNKLNYLLRKCFLFDLDVLLFNYQRVDNKGNCIEKAFVFPDTVSSDNGIDYVKRVFGANFVYHLGYVVRCIYKIDYLKKYNILFPENCFWEDTVYFPKGILYGQRVQSVQDIIYNYRINIESISGNNNKFRAELFFQFAFFAGYDLYLFANEFKQTDQEIGKNLEEKSYRYFNSFTKSLILSPFKQKKKFYSLVRESAGKIKKIRHHLSLRNKILILPFWGLLFAAMLKPLLIINENRKTK